MSFDKVVRRLEHRVLPRQQLGLGFSDVIGGQEAFALGVFHPGQLLEQVFAGRWHELARQFRKQVRRHGLISISSIAEG